MKPSDSVFAFFLVRSAVFPAVAARKSFSHATLVEHEPGTIVGKALEPLAKGTGRIRVLVTLQ